MLFGSERVEHTILHNIPCFTLFFYQSSGAKALHLKLPLLCFVVKIYDVNLSWLKLCIRNAVFTLAYYCIFIGHLMRKMAKVWLLQQNCELSKNQLDPSKTKISKSSFGKGYQLLQGMKCLHIEHITEARSLLTCSMACLRLTYF